MPLIPSQLQAQLASLHGLLYYLDPVLAGYLSQQVCIDGRALRIVGGLVDFCALLGLSRPSYSCTLPYVHTCTSLQGMRCETYAQPWLITLFARRCHVALSLYTLDHLLLLVSPPPPSTADSSTRSAAGTTGVGGAIYTGDNMCGAAEGTNFSGRPYVLVLLACALLMHERDVLLRLPEEELPQHLAGYVWM